MTTSLSRTLPLTLVPVKRHVVNPAFNEADRVRRGLEIVYLDVLPPSSCWHRWYALRDGSDWLADIACSWARAAPAVHLVVNSSSMCAGRSARLLEAPRRLVLGRTLIDRLGRVTLPHAPLRLGPLGPRLTMASTSLTRIGRRGRCRIDAECAVRQGGIMALPTRF